MSEIEVRDLWAGYGEEPVLRGVSFACAAGEFLGILGPNACGKSTLVRVLSGVLRPERGAARVAGLDPAHAAARELARAAATVPQSTEVPFPFTGHELVAMGRYPWVGRFAPLGEADREAVRLALEATDTEALAPRLVTQVSGGERQRLLFARAQAQGTRVLLLDEATAAMDVHRKVDAFELLTRRNAEGVTVVVVMHDLNLAALYCRRLLFLKEGRVFAEGPTTEVFTRTVLEAVYDTAFDVALHPVTTRPFALLLPRGGPP
ncbi:MAG: ABC transporter ATP-binding protein [Deltaproteobacteria bacterium]|nr:ABC transporter ATP-binding protein [Deltaproteobacteria bacterium]